MKKLTILLMLSVSVLFSNQDISDKECSVKGKVIYWAIDYCMYKNSTDDFENEKVQECFARQSYEAGDTCTVKKKYKKKICKLLDEKTFEKCIFDEEFTGTTVRNDGV